MQPIYPDEQDRETIEAIGHELATIETYCVVCHDSEHVGIVQDPASGRVGVTRLCMRRCEGCGCSCFAPCPPEHAGDRACSWTGKANCSRCFPGMAIVSVNEHEMARLFGLDGIHPVGKLRTD